jgi:hypothetical protein
MVHDFRLSQSADLFFEKTLNFTSHGCRLLLIQPPAYIPGHDSLSLFQHRGLIQGLLLFYEMGRLNINRRCLDDIFLASEIRGKLLSSPLSL